MSCRKGGREGLSAKARFMTRKARSAEFFKTFFFLVHNPPDRIGNSKACEASRFLDRAGREKLRRFWRALNGAAIKTCAPAKPARMLSREVSGRENLSKNQNRHAPRERLECPVAQCSLFSPRVSILVPGVSTLSPASSGAPLKAVISRVVSAAETVAPTRARNRRVSGGGKYTNAFFWREMKSAVSFERNRVVFAALTPATL